MFGLKKKKKNVQQISKGTSTQVFLKVHRWGLDSIRWVLDADSLLKGKNDADLYDVCVGGSFVCSHIVTLSKSVCLTLYRPCVYLYNSVICLQCFMLGA